MFWVSMKLHEHNSSTVHSLNFMSALLPLLLVSINFITKYGYVLVTN